MKFSVNYQHLPKGAARPIDDGTIIELEFDSSASGAVVLPNVGDYVQIDNSAQGERSSFSGKVRSRLFTHINTTQTEYCHVNIIVEDDDDDWGLLIKE